MAKYRLGIDLGGTNIKSGVLQGERIIAKDMRPTQSQRPFEAVVADMAASAKAALAQAGAGMADVACVGVGTPGAVDRKTGVVVMAGNTGWRNAPLREALQRHFDAPVFVGNDADCAAAGEMIAGAAQAYDNALLITLGTGVGGGIILGRKLFSGADGLGAEIGHMPLVFGGERCTCGLSGCVEAYASVTGLIRQTQAAMARDPATAMHAYVREKGKVSGRTAFVCARQGDATAQAVVRQYIVYVTAAIGGLVSVFRPQVVLLGGGISAEGAYLLDPINAMLPEYAFAGAQIGVPPVVSAELGNDAGIVGAAYLDIF